MTFQVIKESVSMLNGWTGGMLLLLLSFYLFVRFEIENARFKKNFQVKKTEQTTSV